MSVPQSRCIVLLETSGNQRYIFATNKLRENLGASELTRNAGEGWVIDAVKAIATFPKSHSLSNLADDATINDQREALLGQKESVLDDSSLEIEVVVAASGKAILITQNKVIAQQIIQILTTKALKEAPGLDLCGAFLEIGESELDELKNLSSADFPKQFNALLRQVHERHAFVHARRPGNEMRFLRLPMVDICKTSGMPAETLERVPGDESRWEARSAVSRAKEKVRKTAKNRLNKLLQHKDIASRQWTFPEDSQQLEQTLGNSDGENTWLAVIHADGNGLGQIFLDFAEHLRDTDRTLSRAFSRFRNFSIELDRCTEKAFREALLKTFGNEPQEACLPIVPLILGGDDLTVLCDGRRALNFTASFLRAFEQATCESEFVAAIAAKALGKDNLSACAGVAIVKPHFPFSVAYELAEDLIKSAKTVKKQVQRVDEPAPYPCSALDFHILYDSSNIDLDDIRNRRLTVDSGTTRLTGKPYVVSEISEGKIHKDKLSSDSWVWINQHHWSQLLAQVGQVQTIEQSQDSDDISESGPVLPRSQVYGLRQTLFSGRGAADARLNMLINRYQKEAFKALYAVSEDAPSLFQSIAYQKEEENKLTHFTSYLDALETADFITVN